MVSSNLAMSDRRVSAAKRLETVDLYPMISVPAVQPIQPPMRSHGEFRKEPCACRSGKPTMRSGATSTPPGSASSSCRSSDCQNVFNRPCAGCAGPLHDGCVLPTGLLLIVGSIFSILPILGLWMLPLGLVLLAEDVKPLRHLTDRALVWIEHRRPHWMGLSRTSFAGDRRDR